MTHHPLKGNKNMTLSDRRSEQLINLIARLEVKRKMCHARAEKMTGEDYYTKLGFDKDEEIAEAVQASIIIRKSAARLGIEIEA